MERNGVNFSTAQYAVAVLLARGYGIPRISATISMTPDQVRAHAQAIYVKAGVKGEHRQILFISWWKGI